MTDATHTARRPAPGQHTLSAASSDPSATAPLPARSHTAPASPFARARLLLLGMRPRQWTKNLPLFAGLAFAGRLFDGLSLLRAALAFAIFCLLSGATYLINDLLDLDQDRLHPTKRFRPLASGRLAPSVARLGVAVALLSAALGCAVLIALPSPAAHAGHRFLLTLWPPHLVVAQTPAVAVGERYARFGGSGVLFALIAAAYVILMLAYSLRLKHIVLLDIFAIAAGFVLRAMAGAVAVAVHISPWLYLCAVLLALFLALGKRRQELLLLDANASAHRRILSEYSPQLLDQLITVVTSATLMAYSLYTFQGETGDGRLMLTIPFVLYGIFRYLYLVYVRGQGGSPEEILLRDPHVRWSVVLCASTIALVLYVIP